MAGLVPLYTRTESRSRPLLVLRADFGQFRNDIRDAHINNVLTHTPLQILYRDNINNHYTHIIRPHTPPHKRTTALHLFYVSQGNMANIVGVVSGLALPCK